MKRSMVWVMVCNALVAIAAFLKDVLMASYVGTSAYADSFTLAYFVTDTIANNWLAASIGAAGVTVMAGMYKERPQSLWSSWKSSMIRAFWLSAAVAIFCYMTLWAVVADEWLLLMMSFMVPTIIIFAMMGVCVSALQATERFGVSVAAPLVMHGAILAATALAIGFGLPALTGLTYVAISVTIGAFGTAAWVWVAFTKTPKAGADSDASYVREGQKRMTQLFGAYTLFMLSSQLVMFWERGLAAGLGTGVVTGLNYAFRVSQVPVWVFATAIGAVLLPRIAYLLSMKQIEELKKKIVDAVHLMILITLPISLLMTLWSKPIVAVLFQRGAFDEASVAITSGLLEGYALAIVGYSLSAVLMRYWLADGKIQKAALLMIVGTIITVCTQWILTQGYGPIGIGYGAAIGATVQSLLFLYPMLRGKLFYLWRIHWSEMLRLVLGFAAAFLVSGFGLSLWGSIVLNPSEPVRALFLLSTLTLSFLSYCILTRKRLILLSRSIFEK